MSLFSKNLHNPKNARGLPLKKTITPPPDFENIQHDDMPHNAFSPQTSLKPNRAYGVRIIPKSEYKPPRNDGEK